MKTIGIKGSVRQSIGKKSTKELRKNGMVPCVLYGGEEVIHFQAEESEFRKIIYTPKVFLLDIDVDGTVYKGILQDIQFHPVVEQILHIDFLKISDDKHVKIDIPVRTEGYAKGIQQGGALKLNLRTLRVKALAKDLPDEIVVDVTELALGQSTRVSDVSIEGIELLNTPSVPVATVSITRAARAAKAGGDGDQSEPLEGAEEAEGDEATEEK
jgi:large subunit ribosomal protein L25